MKTFDSNIIWIYIIINNLLYDVSSTSSQVIDINMPGVRPINKNDNYLCTYVKLPSNLTQYIKKFETSSYSGKAHHMVLHGSDTLKSELVEKDWWDCGPDSIFESYFPKSRVLYAWAKNADSLELPKDVGFRIGPLAEIQNLILEIHYAHGLPEGDKDYSGFKLQVTSIEPKYMAGMMIMHRSDLFIPPHTEKIHGEMNCPLRTRIPIHPFAYRVHAHKLGVVISAYKMDKKGRFEEIGRRNPQWPQGFYPTTTKNMTIFPGNFLVARCTYSSINFDKPTQIGPTAEDEMCNFYLMYYTKSRDIRGHFLGCGDEYMSKLSQHLPPNSDALLPRNATMEEYAKSGKIIVQSNEEIGEFLTMSFLLLVLVGLALSWINKKYLNKDSLPNSDLEKLISEKNENDDDFCS